MITAVDTNVILDVFQRDAVHWMTSRDLLAECYEAGGIVVSAVVYAELARPFRHQTALDKAMRTLNVRVDPITDDIAFLAGLRWGEYRAAGGGRSRILPDFLIGAHALACADRLLTRDRGFYRTYFKDLEQIGSE